jgi:DNA-binding response OmpR family regulator
MEKKLRLLAVDDSRIIRLKIKQEFAEEGFEVFEAEDGRVALDKLAEVQPDVITMDIDMPNMNGYEATMRIRKGDAPFAQSHPELRSVPIVFLTANDTDEERRKGFEAGATEFVTKPFFPGELLAYVNIVLKPVQTVKGATILVVDESLTIRMIVKSGLKTRGLQIIEACNAAEAMRLLADPAHPVDLVITSFMMTQMDGVALCQSIRNDLGMKTLPVIVMSGFCEKKQVVKMFQAGVTDYLGKPFIFEELHARIDARLHVQSLQRDVRQLVGELKQLHRNR